MSNVNVDISQLYQKFALLPTKYALIKVKFDAGRPGRDSASRIWGYEWLDAGLPTPTIQIFTKQGYYIGYSVEGKIQTKAQEEFFRDIKHRIKETINHEIGTKLAQVSNVFILSVITPTRVIHTKRIYKLKELAKYCLSLPGDYYKKEKREKKKDDVFKITYDKTEDAIFDYIRFKVYEYIREHGKDNRMAIIEYALNIANEAYEIFGGESKGISDFMSKARNIAQWSYENYEWNWNGYKRKTKDDKELKMTRQENARKIAQEKKEKTRKKIASLLTGIYKQDYIKKSGEYNISKISKELNISRQIVRKHIQELKEEGII